MSMLVYCRFFPLYATVLTALLAVNVYAQTIDNISTQFDGERIIVTYDLNHVNTFEKFNVALYSSHDNYTKPLAQVTGALGENITAGKSKRVVWDVKNALPADFDDEIAIRIKISKMKGPQLVIEPLTASVYKRGRTLSIQWTGGYPAEMLTLDLDQNNVTITRVTESMSNGGSYEWKMPKSIKGKNYELRLAPVLRPEEQVSSQVFRVKPKTPFIVKALPVLVVGGVLYFLSGSGGGEPGGGAGILPGPLKPG